MQIEAQPGVTEFITYGAARSIQRGLRAEPAEAGAHERKSANERGGLKDEREPADGGASGGGENVLAEVGKSSQPRGSRNSI